MLELMLGVVGGERWKTGVDLPAGGACSALVFGGEQLSTRGEDL